MFDFKLTQPETQLPAETEHPVSQTACPVEKLLGMQPFFCCQAERTGAGGSRSTPFQRTDHFPRKIDDTLDRGVPVSTGQVTDSAHDRRSDNQPIGHRRQQPHVFRAADAETDADREVSFRPQPADVIQ